MNILYEITYLLQRTLVFKIIDGTINQLIPLTNIICENLDSGIDVCSMFLDISKGFDWVYHKGLIFELKQSGICGNPTSASE